MDKRTFILSIAILALIVVGMFTFAHLKNQELKQDPVVVEETADLVPYSEITRIDAKHYFRDGQHTYVGEILMPTPCDLLTTEALVMESFPEQIKLQFSVINNSDTCAQMLTPQRFLITATASGEAVAAAIFMGRVVELNLIPAAKGELPADFELFIKG